MKHAIERQVHMIVAVGDLNPAIFQPAWFAAEGIINSQEAAAATIDVISAQATLFHVDWLRVQVVPDRFVVATENEAYYQHLHDLVASTFSKLVHTPIRAIGINYSCHCRFEDETRWDNISREFAPANPWSDLLHEPRMRSLTMQGARPSGPMGRVEITVEPSMQINNGMYIHVNNHYDLAKEDLGSRAMLRVLESEWRDTMQKYKFVLERIVPGG